MCNKTNMQLYPLQRKPPQELSEYNAAHADPPLLPAHVSVGGGSGGRRGNDVAFRLLLLLLLFCLLSLLTKIKIKIKAEGAGELMKQDIAA